VTEEIAAFLKEKSRGGLISLKYELKAAELFSCSLREAERTALELGLVPLRYKKNQKTIDAVSQKKLFEAHVAILGCGGLGGNVAEMLTRVGVGKLSLFDPDVFEEHNLNRQNFSTWATLGRKKVEVLKEALEGINPALEIRTFAKEFRPGRDFGLLTGADVVVDALDRPEVKLETARVCKEKGVAFVHAAIAGLSGQFATNSTLDRQYREGGPGAEAEAGNPSFSAAFAASVQAAEVVKLILGIGKTLEGEILFTDLLDVEFVKILL